MGTYDETVYTAACDVCDALREEIGDWMGWYQFASEAEDEAIRAGWTSVNGLLICKVDDEDHRAARGEEGEDDRPKPGPGQLVLL